MTLPLASALAAHRPSGTAARRRGANALVQLVSGDVQPDRSLLYIGLSVLSIVAALALLAGRRFGWLLAMGFIGADLAGEILLWYWARPTTSRWRSWRSVRP